MTIKHLLYGLPVAALSLGLVACDVETTEEGNFDLPEIEKTQEGNIDLPDVDVSGGDLTLPRYEMRGGDMDVPDVDVKGPDVDMDTGTTTIEVPTADVDITPAPEGSAAQEHRAEEMTTPAPAPAE